MSAIRRLPLPQPYDLPWTRWYLQAHTVPGLEAYDEGRYARTLTLSSGPALLSLRLDDETVAYGVPRGSTGEDASRQDTWAVPADGSGRPRLLREDA